MIDYEVNCLHGYRDNGEHLEIQCGLDLFEIRRGEDGYTYHTGNGKWKDYNLLKDKTSKMWIINLTDANTAPEFIANHFQIKTSKDPIKLIKYAHKLYIKCLKKELKRVEAL